jgi:hypothetical protein
MEKIEYRYRFWYRYRPKFMVSDWYRIVSKPKKLVSPITKYCQIEASSFESVYKKQVNRMGGGVIIISSSK